MDNKEWGGFEQIVMWSRIYYIKIEIYSFGIDMQTVDGDELMQDRECIILLYCNKGRWGEQPNHYDLMHPIEKEGKNIKRYTIIDKGEQDQQNKEERTKTIERPSQGPG
eukprot:10815806-Heterocapsa_arctica.AAC.1